MRYSPFYRIIVVVFCLAILGFLLILPFLNDPSTSWVALFVLLGIWGAALVGTIVGMEVMWHKRHKKEDQEKALEPVNDDSEKPEITEDSHE